MVVDALYIALVTSNLLLLAACYRFGPRVKTVARIAIRKARKASNRRLEFELST